MKVVDQATGEDLEASKRLSRARQRGAE